MSSVTIREQWPDGGPNRTFIPRQRTADRARLNGQETSGNRHRGPVCCSAWFGVFLLLKISMRSVSTVDRLQRVRRVRWRHADMHVVSDI